MIQTSRTTVLAGVFALMACAPAVAQDVNWTACDGYEGVSRSADGVSRYANVLLNIEVNWDHAIARVAPNFGVDAIAACNTALEALPPQHWRRRVNLLQARALHKASIGNGDEALADVLLATEAAEPGRSDPLFQRSQGVGLLLSRAFVLDRMNRRDEALPLLVEAQSLRPYDRSVASAVSAMLMKWEETDLAASAQISHARLEPQRRSAVAVALFNEGSFGRFLELYPALVAAREYPQESELPVSTALRELEDHERAVQYRVTIDSMAGYAFTAMGRYDEAAASFAKARATLVAGRETPRPPRLYGSAARQYQEQRDGSWARIQTVTSIIESMERTAARRKMIADGQGEAVLLGLTNEPLPRDGSGFDTLLALSSLMPERDAVGAQAAVQQQRRQPAADSNKDALTLHDLFMALPPAEVVDGPLAWRHARRPLLAMRGSARDLDAVGYRDEVQDNGIVTIRFRSLANPLNQVEEMALLRAAQLAREGGHAAFLVVDRRDTAWSRQMSFNNIPGATWANGYESEIDVRFVDRGAADTGNEMTLDADAVYNALSAAYMRERPR